MKIFYFTLNFISGIFIILITVSVSLMLFSTASQAQSYYNSTQEINIHQHYMEIMKQQQRLLQQQYIQTQQLDQMRRDAEQRFNRDSNQSNRSHEQVHLIGR